MRQLNSSELRLIGQSPIVTGGRSRFEEFYCQAAAGLAATEGWGTGPGDTLASTAFEIALGLEKQLADALDQVRTAAFEGRLVA